MFDKVVHCADDDVLVPCMDRPVCCEDDADDRFSYWSRWSL